ncbi:SRPBCC family protein [Pedobacter psychroterrae]|uniref:DUF2892 domain-containing protein n=1 Tax=Pedobacter psychroterrae TaxID=2530453 RepID=A0A4R0NKE0_9SPHI|nr:SRPBCC family protein [Pedobacter psychroterrae]TCD00328.1 DUF2892 domain-containing protein [Pedobacter psychroterrae]
MELHRHNLRLKSGNFSIEKHHYENIGLTERMISMFLGGVLISRSITKPFKSRFLYGAYLSYRGLTGHCLFYDRLGIDATNPKAINIRGEFEIERSPAEVYAHWRNVDNLPGSIKYLLNVKVRDESLSDWKSRILSKVFSMNWDIEIVKDEPGHLIGWRSAYGSTLGHVGKVTFEESKHGGTMLKVVLSYHPPIGGVGIALGKFLNPYLEHLLKKEIKNFKHTIEDRVLS